jgi:hypothetical protein
MKSKILIMLRKENEVMEERTLIDILHELLVVETEENTVKETYEKGNEIYVITNDGSEFSIKVTKIR